MLGRLSLRARLVLGVIMLAAVGLVAADIATYTSLRSFLFDRVDNTIDAAHPECVGYCITHVCADTKPVGGACKVAAECGPNHACVGGKCLGTPLPNRGEPCTGGECVKGAACIDGKCGEPRAEGEACGSDLECRGLCDKPDAGAKTDAGASGKCVKRCEGTLPPKR